MDSNNIMDRMQELLSDPESLQQLQELADMLNSETPPQDTPQSPDTSDTIDFSKVLQLVQLFNSTSNSQDTTLLLAIKPYLTSERQGRVDKAIKLMKAYEMFITARDSGLLSQLDNLI